MATTEQTWTVPAEVIRVHDGDTVVVRADLGWHVSLTMAVRVDGLAAPELKTDAGKLSRDYAAQLLPPGAPVTVVSKKLLGSFEKYGRVLADLAFRAAAAPAQGSFALAMIAAGQAVAWDGSGKQPGT